MVASAVSPVMPIDANTTVATMSPSTIPAASTTRPMITSGPKRPAPNPSNRWLMRSGSPRASAWHPSITPPANTGMSNVCAMPPRNGTSISRNMMTSRMTTIPSHTHGDAAKTRHPSPHHDAP
jgi:hypothetical protein